MSHPEFVYLWKRYTTNGEEKLHLGKYKYDTGKWVKWESQSNEDAKSQADYYAKNGVFAPDF